MNIESIDGLFTDSVVYPSEPEEYQCFTCWDNEGYWLDDKRNVICCQCGIITGQLVLDDVLLALEDEVGIPKNWFYLSL